MEADDLLCSRNARLKKALVGRAQWKINQPPSPEETTSELGGIICNLVRRPHVENAEQYVAFIDVLGFSSLVEADFDGIVKIYDKMIESTAIVEKLRPDVSLRVFSDAFVMASPQLSRLVGAVQMLLMQTLFNDLLVRGGVGFGRHIEKSEEGRLQVVSQALVKAVQTEKRTTFPCVALDESVVTDESWWPKEVPNQYRGLLYFDGIRLVNPCNVAWGQSAGMRVLQLRELHPIHAEKHDWFLRLHSAIMGDEPLVPQTT